MNLITGKKVKIHKNQGGVILICPHLITEAVGYVYYIVCDMLLYKHCPIGVYGKMARRGTQFVPIWMPMIC